MIDKLENIQVTYVADKKANITCLKCTKQTEIDLDNKTNLLDKFIVGYKCKCGYKGKMKFEKRVSYRKPVHLRCRIKREGENLGWVDIKDLSRTGCRFEANLRIKLEAEDRLELEFRLDDSNRSLIQQKGIIRWSRNYQYGVEFEEIDRETDKRLGFYFL